MTALDKTPDGAMTARVDVLTAEVRTLVVGNRQVTLSVYKQLDTVHCDVIEPFGRVNTGRTVSVRSQHIGFTEKKVSIEVVGRIRSGYEGQGSLARSYLVNGGELYADWSTLPLIVLAGLR